MALCAAACGTDEVTAPPDGPGERPPGAAMAASVVIEPDSLSPGDTVIAKVYVSGVLWADTVVLSIDGPWAGSIGLPLEERVFVGLELPREDRWGDMVFEVAASNQWETVTHADTVVILDRRPPVMRLSPNATSLLPGGSLEVRLEASDNAALCYTVLRVSGAVSHVDSSRVDGQYADALRDMLLQVPVQTPMGDSLALEAIAGDCHDLADTVRSVVPVTDVGLPAVGGTVEAVGWPVKPGDLPQFVPGDTMTIRVSATDEWRLGWVGYRLDHLQLGDSVPAGGAADSAVFEVAVPGGRDDCLRCRVELFARDSVGNRRLEYAEASVIDAERRPYRLVEERSLTDVIECTVDTTRDVAFFALEGRSRVAVMSLADNSFLSDISFSSAVTGMDLTPSGDSLVAALSGGPHLGVVDLTEPAWTAGTLKLAGLEYPEYVPAGVRVAANNRAFVTTQSGFKGYGVDFATGDQGLLPGADYGWSVVRSGDRSVLMFVFGDRTALVHLYHSGSDFFEEPFWTEARAVPLIDGTGTLVLTQNGLTDLHFNLVREVHWVDLRYTRPDFSADGSRLFLPLEGYLGYRVLSVPAGEQLERIAVPSHPSRIWATPDGKYLLLYGYAPSVGGPALNLVVDLQESLP